MRIVIAVCIWLIIVGGLSGYMHQRNQTIGSSLPAFETKAVEESYTLMITTTFAAEPDPFALTADVKEKPPALLVRLGNTELVRITDRLGAGATLRVEPLSGLVVGKNEIYFEASPPMDMTGYSHAVRIQILRGDQPAADKTFWSTPGGKISGVLEFTLSSGKKEKKEHDHS